VPRIRISAQKDTTVWQFSVADNGIGIEAQDLAAIFVPFKRLHAGEYPGTGLGLAMCQRIVERYQGRIWVESVPGQGSIFHFTLPVADGAS
jgi:signal transduction histidine kinase